MPNRPTPEDMLEIGRIWLAERDLEVGDVNMEAIAHDPALYMYVQCRG